MPMVRRKARPKELLMDLVLGLLKRRRYRRPAEGDTDGATEEMPSADRRRYHRPKGDTTVRRKGDTIGPAEGKPTVRRKGDTIGPAEGDNVGDEGGPTAAAAAAAASPP
jgi:hypothetical protein